MERLSRLMARLVRGDHGNVLRLMRLPSPMEAFYATTDYADHLCALPQSHKSSSCAIFSCHENQFPWVIPASLCLLFLPHLHTNSTGTTGPARILRTLPRLPPGPPIRHLSRSKCGGLPLSHHRSLSRLRIASHIEQGREL